MNSRRLRGFQKLQRVLAAIKHFRKANHLAYFAGRSAHRIAGHRPPQQEENVLVLQLLVFILKQVQRAYSVDLLLGDVFASGFLLQFLKENDQVFKDLSLGFNGLF